MHIRATGEHANIYTGRQIRQADKLALELEFWRVPYLRKNMGMHIWVCIDDMHTHAQFLRPVSREQLDM